MARSIRLALLASVLCCAMQLAAGDLRGDSFSEFVDPNPAPGNRFGDTVMPLSTGNVVITSPYDDAGGTDAGAVYLFNGATGTLISTLRGSHDYDYVGNRGVTALTNGNFVVGSRNWNNGAIVNAGAVTWGSGTSGVNGVVSAVNSLVGSTAGDGVGSDGVTALPNGNYVLRSRYWDNGSIVDAGAVTWGSGTSGVTGPVSAGNSLVGSTVFDQIGSDGVTVLTNGNYVVRSQYWDNGPVIDAGAVTWGSGTSGVNGVVSAANSLVGSTAGDVVGRDKVTALTNGNYVVRSQRWDNGPIADVGAATWGSGTSGVSGPVSAANSLVGSAADDRVGSAGVTALENGSYVVRSPLWNNAAITNAGAATWASGTSGVNGPVSEINSLVGSAAFDDISGSGVTALTNGNYVVQSRYWDNGAIVDAGAATWGSGKSGVIGPVSAANSLVGSTAYDYVGMDGVTALTNGNYVVHSWNWDNGAVSSAGAATWGSGVSGVSGVISAANSLVGSTAGDCVGIGLNGVTALTDGNYVVASPLWDNGAIVDVGAVTWGSGTSGVVGPVSAANSLVGSTPGDNVGGWEGVSALTNGNFVVQSRYWDNGAIADAGAVTWGSGMGGVNGLVSSANSLVGSTANDMVGGVTALTNGNYVVHSWDWDNGAIVDAGAATWGSGTSGVSGAVSAANSLVGSTADDRVGFRGETPLTNGDYVVLSPSWHNDAMADVGAATWGSGTSGITGVISTTNSLVGEVAGAKFSTVLEDVVNGTFIVPTAGENGGHVRVGAPALVGIDQVGRVPLALSAPWPNPARETISFVLDLDEGSIVWMELYDIAGRLVARPLERRWLGAGRLVQSWEPHGLVPGIYHVQAHAGDHAWVRRFVWLGR